jgi:predicted Rossmann fold flavoprotein
MQEKGQTDTEILVIGGGASGLKAAGRAAEEGARVVLLEKTDAPGKKILVSGKPRCNLTNAADLPSFIAMYGPNGRFLHGAFSRFFSPELLAFFERYGLLTKTERGGGIFPISDSAGDVVRVFESYLADHRVRTVFSAPVRSVAPAGRARLEVRTANGRYLCLCRYSGGRRRILARYGIDRRTVMPWRRRSVTQSLPPGRRSCP